MGGAEKKKNLGKVKSAGKSDLMPLIDRTEYYNVL